MKNLSLIAAATAAVFTSCTNDSQFEGFEKAESGLHFKFYNHDEDARKIQSGDGVTFSYYICKQDNDSVIVNSHDVSRDGSGYVQFAMSDPTFRGSFEDAMMMMAKGDSAAFIISADSFFLKTQRANELPAGFSPGDYLRGVFRIKDVRTKEELAENQKKQMAERDSLMKEYQTAEKPSIERYLSDNKINVKPTASGLYYIEDKKGSGPTATLKDMVRVHYTGKFLNGEKFDSSFDHGQPVEFRLDEVIAGWTEALQLMRKGGKARLVIPSNLAYGPQGRQNIPPFSPLYFEIELLEILTGQADSMPPR